MCERAALEQIAERHGTPTYVYSRAAIEANYREYQRAFRSLPATICYSVKANSNLSILRLLAKCGSGFDIVSGGELYLLRRAGISPKRVVFSGVGKTRDEIREAVRVGILLFNVESEGELDVLQSEAARLRKRAPAAIRVNPDVEAGGHRHIATGRHQHKFGLDWRDARRVYRAHRDSRWLEWKGISAHVGSQILDLKSVRRGLERLAEYVGSLRRDGIRPTFIDIGGGLGIRYALEKAPSISQHVRLVTSVLKPLGCRLLLEPGRSIVGPAGVLLMRALYTKVNRGKKFIVVDAGMNDFIRPALYSAAHPVTPIRRDKTRPRIIRADIVGPVCESGDCFLHDWPIEEVHAGDLLALWGAGAYGYTETSNYNARCRPAEILVSGSKALLIRRRESRSDLVRGE
ncbi:MAG: diaminopimelate decarboxylase [Candidatus Acidiferrales bacterium]